MLAHYDQATGQIRGFFDPAVHSEIPEPSIEVSDADWHAHLDRSALKAVDVDTGELVPYVARPKPEPVARAEREAMARAECRRRIYAVASAEAQVNMATAAAVAAATPDEAEAAALLAGVAAALAWVADMRTTWPALAGDFSAEIGADTSWPECPAAVVDLVGQF